MLQKTNTPKSKTFKLPVQNVTFAVLQNKISGFQKKYNEKPTRLILQFEVDLNLTGKNFYLIGYLKSGSGSHSNFERINLPQSSGQDIKVPLPGDKVALGNIDIRLSKLLSLGKSKGVLTFTPKLYPNPHIAYDINGSDFNPSPPARPI